MLSHFGVQRSMLAIDGVDATRTESAMGSHVALQSRRFARAIALKKGVSTGGGHRSIVKSVVGSVHRSNDD